MRVAAALLALAFAPTVAAGAAALGALQSITVDSDGLEAWVSVHPGAEPMGRLTRSRVSTRPVQAAAGLATEQRPRDLTAELVGQGTDARVRLTATDIRPGQRFEVLLELNTPAGRLARGYRIAATPTGASGQVLGPSRFGPTTSQQNLYRIANAIRPRAVTGNQMMLALLAANPDRFNRNNINALQRGVLLDIPSEDELELVPIAEADQRVRAQNKAWLDNGTDNPTRANPEPTVAARTRDPAPGPVTADPGLSIRPLRLLPPPEALVSEVLETPTFQRLEQQIEQMRASNETLAQENRQLERSLAAMQQSLVDLQGELAVAREPDGVAQLISAAETQWQRAMTEPQQAWRVPLLQYTLLGVLGLGLMSLWIIGGRRRRRAVAERSMPARWQPQTGRPESSPDTADVVLGDTSVQGQAVDHDSALEAAGELIAHGRLDEAQMRLDDALGAAPDDLDLRLKLLDVLYMRGDRAGFEAEAHVLHAQLGDDSDERWQRVQAQGRTLAPTHPLFAGPTGGSSGPG
jgi:pilus assembly protein FimV